MISYGKCTKAQYEALTPVQDRIYYITDTGEQFLNGLPYNGEDNKDYLCLTAETDGATVGLKYDATPSAYPIVWHSADRRTWTAFEWTGNVTDVATLANAGDKVYLRAFDGGFGNTAAESTNLKFSMTGTIAASGNVMSLLHGDDFETRSEVPAFGFQNLFRGCASLVEPPEMPATRLGVRAYYCMFYGCALRHCPELPARTLTQACYGSMFGGGLQQFAKAEIGASSFEADPDFTLSEMAPLNKTFKGCASLATVTAHFELWSTTDIGAVATNWLQNTAATGVFRCPSALDTTTRDASHVPAGWSVIYTEVEAGKTIPSATSSDAGKVLTVNASGTPEWDAAQGGGGSDPLDYLCFTAGQTNCTVALNKNNASMADLDLEYSTDKQTWTQYTWESGSTAGAVITLANAGDRVYFRGDNEAFSTSDSNYYKFAFSVANTNNPGVYASGNIMSLLDKTCQSVTIPCDYCFYMLFNNCNSLMSAPRMPAVNFNQRQYFYGNMFANCGSLASVPDFPVFGGNAFGYSSLYGCNYAFSNMFYRCSSLAKMPLLRLSKITIPTGCFFNMFANCTALVDGSQLVASNPTSNNLGYRCFDSMFSGCSSLTRAPELPFLFLGNNCYANMFSGCTSLKEAPSLPATTMKDYCYSSMFKNCTSLKEAPSLPATTMKDNCYESMFENCSSLVNPPELSATSTDGAYWGSTMFLNCSSLSRTPVIAASTLARNSYYLMFEGCSSIRRASEVAATGWSTCSHVSMFQYCTNLRYAKVGLTATGGGTIGMFYETTDKGVLDCPATLDPSAILPSGWTVCHNDYDASLEPESFEIPAASTAQLLLPPTRFFQKPDQAVTYTLWHDPAKSIEEVVIVVDMATSNLVSFQDENGNAISYGQDFAVGLIVEFKCVCAGGAWKIVATKLV